VGSPLIAARGTYSEVVWKQRHPDHVALDLTFFRLAARSIARSAILIAACRPPAVSPDLARLLRSTDHCVAYADGHDRGAARPYIGHP
jgi:hypothetical protein